MTKRIVNLRRQRAPVARRKSIRYFSDEPARDLLLPNLHGRMFNEDVALGMMPVFARSRPNFKVRLDPSHAAREAEVSRALDGSAERDLAGGLTTFLRKVVGEILDEGHCAYEIAYFAENETAAPTQFQLAHVDARQLTERNDAYVQSVPREIATSHHVPTEIIIPRADVLMLSLPPDLAATVRKVKAALRRIDAPEYMQFITEAHSLKLPYDFKAHERIKQLALAEAGRLVGWTARGSFNREVLSYYWIQLQLDFETFKLRVRDHLLAQLNVALQHAGQQVGFMAAIYLEGLPTLAEIARAREQLKAGNMAFTEVMKPFQH